MCAANDYMSVSGSILCNWGVRDKYNHEHGNGHVKECCPASGLRQSFKPDCNDAVVHSNELSQTSCTISLSGEIEYRFVPQTVAVCVGVIG